MARVSEHNDLTIIYYSANVVDNSNVRKQLLKAADGRPIVSVTHKPTDLGKNITVDMPRHHLSIYKQALIGADAAKTKYIAFAEDDVLYSPEHFKYRSSKGKFAYNVGHWSIHTWKPDMFSWRGRRNMCHLICERELFLEAMTERFIRWPDDEKINLGKWAEPGKYETLLRVTPRETEIFWTNPPNIVFIHEDALAFENLGKRKRHGTLRATAIPRWGDVGEVMKLWRE